MGRGIKFRGWDTTKKAWKGLWIFRGGHTNQYDVSKTEIDILDLSKFWDYDVKIMQYTGLRDSRGKEIYEGDIIKYHDYYESFGKVKEDIWRAGEIVWNDDKLCFLVEHNKGHGPYQMNFYHQKQIEIIGNIYETPGLLK